jgi:hypothetical protein
MEQRLKAQNRKTKKDCGCVWEEKSHARNFSARKKTMRACQCTKYIKTTKIKGTQTLFIF